MTPPADSRTLAPDILDLFEQVEAIRRDAGGLVAGLRPDQLAWRPAPDRWSIADCLEHLTRTAEVSFRGFDRMVEQARARGLTRRKPFEPGFVERWLLSGMEPPPRRKFKVGAALAPAPDCDPAAAVSRFLSAQDVIEARLRDVNGLDLRRIRVPSPVVRWLRYRLGFALHLLLAHERRHLWQARRVREDPAFPA